MNMSQLSSWSLFLVCYGIIDIGVVECACSSSCSSCIDDKCERCLDGTYLDNNTGCLICPDRCPSCYDADYCYTCSTGYFGITCTQPCTSQFCVNNECERHTGHCTSGCKEGYFQLGAECIPCYPTCNTYVNLGNNCTHCKEGYYGPGCQYNCSHCKYGQCSKDSCINGCGDGYYNVPDACIPCNTRCTSCSTFENCHACRDGYWGSGCWFTCIDCTPCNKGDASCAPEETTTTQRIPTSNTQVTDMLKTTSNIKETSGPEMTTEASSTIPDISGLKGTDDDNDLLYPAVIGWVLVVLLIGVVIVLVVVVYRRRVNTNQEHNRGINVSPSDRVSISQDYTSLSIRTIREDENQYSVLQNPGPMVSIATNSTNNTILQEENAGETNPTSSQLNGADGGRIYINT